MTVCPSPLVRLIAFYLPQFHPIPENDAWWGKGFTEWTNVAKAKPLFPGHYQPHIPGDLGFYDLRVPETRAAQAEMARTYGIEGFCYWHYWFSGKRLLERPFNEVLKSGEPNFPFCLAWANQTWTGIWHGASDRILIEQTYPGIQDYQAHFYAVLSAFQDPRYTTCEGKPVFIVHRPAELPEPRRFTDLWRELAVKTGLKGIYFLGIAGHRWSPNENGFDASILDNPGVALQCLTERPLPLPGKVWRKASRLCASRYKPMLGLPTVIRYRDVMQCACPPLNEKFTQYPCVIPNWDNTPRSGANGVVFHQSAPELFWIHFRQALEQSMHRELGKRFVFVKSWNEWAEGNYLEPDLRFGHQYLDVVREEVLGSSHGTSDREHDGLLVARGQALDS